MLLRRWSNDHLSKTLHNAGGNCTPGHKREENLPTDVSIAHVEDPRQSTYDAWKSMVLEDVKPRIAHASHATAPEPESQEMLQTPIGSSTGQQHLWAMQWYQSGCFRGDPLSHLQSPMLLHTAPDNDGRAHRSCDQMCADRTNAVVAVGSALLASVDQLPDLTCCLASRILMRR